MLHWLASLHKNPVALKEFSVPKMQSIPLSAIGVTVNTGQKTTVEKTLRFLKMACKEETGKGPEGWKFLLLKWKSVTEKYMTPALTFAIVPFLKFSSSIILKYGLA